MISLYGTSLLASVEKLSVFPGAVLLLDHVTPPSVLPWISTSPPALNVRLASSESFHAARVAAAPRPRTSPPASAASTLRRRREGGGSRLPCPLGWDSAFNVGPGLSMPRGGGGGGGWGFPWGGFGGGGGVFWGGCGGVCGGVGGVRGGGGGGGGGGIRSWFPHGGICLCWRFLVGQLCESFPRGTGDGTSLHACDARKIVTETR